MKHFFSILFFLTLWSPQTVAQQNTVASGGDYNGSNGTVSFSIGQIDYLNITNANGNVNQGVQQPYQILDNSVNQSDLNVNITIGPNPSSNELTVVADFTNMKDVSGYITEQNGKILKKKQILNINPSFDLKDLSSGTYFLIIEQNDQILKSFKIIKN